MALDCPSDGTSCSDVNLLCRGHQRRMQLPQDVRTWKSSPLPLMFHAPRFWEHHVHIDDMKEAAKEIQVKLRVNGAGIPNLELQQGEAADPAEQDRKY